MAVKLELYRVFKEVAETGNISQAAKNLYISQSAVSQSVKQLETALEQYDTGSYGGVSYASLFDQAAVHFLPMVNPDGVSISQYGMQGITSPALRQLVQDAYAKDLAEELVGRILADYDYSGSEVAVMVNGLGGTPLMELYIMYNEVEKYLAEKQQK